MEQNNRYRQPPASGTGEEIRQFLRQRKRVPVNTGLIILNLLYFWEWKEPGSALDTNHMLRWGAMYALIFFSRRILSSDNFYASAFWNTCIWEIICWSFSFWEIVWNVMWEKCGIFWFICWEDLEPTVFLYGWNCRMENISFLQERQAQYLPLLAHSSMWCLSIKEKLKILRQGSFCLWQR